MRDLEGQPRIKNAMPDTVLEIILLFQSRANNSKDDCAETRLMAVNCEAKTSSFQTF